MKRKGRKKRFKNRGGRRSVEAASALAQDRDALDGVRTYCMFLGYPRSGHSLIGALLDAHPNMIVAHELNALAYLKAGFGRQHIFRLLLRNSRRHAGKGRQWGKYSYAVPDQWQGRYRELRVIGDKKGGTSSRMLGTNPGLLDRLAEVIPLQRKYIHVVRNPYDTISTMSMLSQAPVSTKIDRYFAFAQTIAGLTERIPPGDVFVLRHEAFIEQPQTILRDLCRFLGEDAPEDYLNACCGIVNRKAHQTRWEAAWSAEDKQVVTRKMAGFPWFSGYDFESTH